MDQKAEDILDPFIKGDLKRDFDKKKRDFDTVSITVALKAIRKALELQEKEPECPECSSKDIDYSFIRKTFFCNACDHDWKL